MILFVKLFLAHLIGDFILQPDRWVIHKEANKIASKYLYVHVLIHFAVTMLLLWDIHTWDIAVIIAVTHYLIDLTKLYVNPLFKNKSALFFIDQFLHIVVLYACTYQNNTLVHLIGYFEEMNWSLVTAVVFVSFPTAVIMNKLLQGFSDQIELDHKSLPNAGKYIGIIERLFVFAFIVLGRWEGIGLLIAAKSVFRFNDLKETNSRKLTEYILIGTLLSFGFAILAGIVYTNS